MLLRLRAGTQTVCLVAFVYLALAVQFEWRSPAPHDPFVRFDPLVWLLSTTASREVAVYGSFALAMVIATALFGRLFCGWACPLGTVLDAARRLRGRRHSSLLAQQLSSLRFCVLALLVGAAIVGANFVSWLDPLVMSSRALHLLDGSQFDWKAAAIGWATVAAVIALVFVAPRFWCRSLCPLGATLSLAAGLAPYRRRVSESCTECGECAIACPMGQSAVKHSPTECIVCRRCEAACAERATAFAGPRSSTSVAGRSGPEQPIDRRRRQCVLGLSSLVVGAAAGGMLRVPSTRSPLRPPGASNEQRFAARCVGCGACMAVCPTGGLLPMASARRPDAFFTPLFVPQVGPCSPECTACGEACPTGAIPRISTEEKKAIRIGLAVIDRARCLPWTGDVRCVICLDACPPEYQAIELRPTPDGPFHPYIKQSQCTGCGVCEHKCPVEGEPAVRVVAASEITAAGN